MEEPTPRAEEREGFARQTAAQVRRRESQPVVDVPARSDDVAYLPLQRSCRVVAAGWLRRRREPEVSG